MVRSDKNVVHTFEKKLPNDDADFLAGARKVVSLGSHAFEDFLLLETGAIVEVAEGPMSRIVGEKLTMEMKAARGILQRKVETHAQISFLRQRFNFAQFAFELISTGFNR